ncbi:MAG: M28 family peptidase [Candidatus Marinimicrobia bacterium]|nr:M28 family peptidase [Candidatus Neomarinimicrobiota bacterium]MCF7904078.1 M28 family peptidase [Candidatus Neomarinimicrobiota bacterium]
MRYILGIFYTLLLLSTVVIAGDEANPAELAQSISWEDYWAHVSYFASDELQGRNTGSEGYDLAAKYAAEKFKAAGLQPFGDDSTYFQRVPFNRARLTQSTFDLTFVTQKGAISTEYGETVSASLNTADDNFSGKADLVFVGYGNIIPEAEIDDYAGVDVSSKVVVFAMGAPESVPDSLQLGTRSKLKIAEEQGAKGAILFSPAKWRERTEEFGKYHRWLGGSRLYISEPELDKRRNNLDMIYILRESMARKLFRKSGLNLRRELRKLKKGEPRSQDLNASVSCSYDLTLENNDCKNVIGLLPGTDSLLKHEYVIVGAHMDHSGIGTPVEGDSILNGVWDNATGAGSTISIAESFYKAGIKPKRSIVFVNYTGEEKGLLGSHYFANTYCVDSINGKVNVNIDMPGSPTATTDLTPLGYSHSTVSEAVDRIAEDLDVDMSDATRLEKRFIHRSDQMSFMKLGMPLINFNQGEHAVDPAVDVKDEFENWMKTRYHKPSDDLNQPFDVNGFFTALKANFLATYYLASEIDTIEWYDDSWVYKEHVLPALDTSD